MEKKNTVFLSQKVGGNTIFTDYWKILVLIFSGMGNTVFFESKSWWKDYIYWLLKSSCFDLFGNGKYAPFWAKKLMERWYLLVTEKFLFWAFRRWEIRSFLNQKVNGKMIFTWSFWAFHDIPVLGKYGFSCSVFRNTPLFKDKRVLSLSAKVTESSFSFI